MNDIQEYQSIGKNYSVMYAGLEVVMVTIWVEEVILGRLVVGIGGPLCG